MKIPRGSRGATEIWPSNMKRQSENTISRVFAYGCASPTEGLAHAMAEDERQRKFWDVLVGIDRHAERQTWQAAAADATDVATALAEVGRLNYR